MSVTLTGTGGLFTRLGLLGKTLNNVNGFLGTADPSAASLWGAGGTSITNLDTLVDAIRDQFLTSRTDLIDGLYSQRDSYRGAHGSLTGYLQTLAQTFVIEQVNDDTRLASKSLVSALEVLISQMSGVASVPRPTVSASVAAGGSNNGDGVCVASVTDADGVQLDYLFNETISVTCTSDSQKGTTEGQEAFDALGDVAQEDALAWDWPKGSGASLSLTAVDPSVDAGTNILTNSDFENFSSQVPDFWTRVTGSTSTVTSAGSGYRGDNALKIIGDGSELTELTQIFNDSVNGTAGVLVPSTVYAVNVFAKQSGSLAAGVLTISLVDGSGTVVNDDAGTANTLTINYSDLTSSFAAKNTFFRTPSVLPDTIKLRIKLTTALTNAEYMILDDLALTTATQAYAGGPWLAVFSGATKFIVDDTFTVTISNDYGSAWALALERFLGLRDLGLKIPASGSPTIADSLIEA